MKPKTCKREGVVVGTGTNEGVGFVKRGESVAQIECGDGSSVVIHDDELKLVIGERVSVTLKRLDK